jgi:hypothetical protein
MKNNNEISNIFTIFPTFKGAEEFTLSIKSTRIPYMGIYQTPKSYSVWYMWEHSPASYVKKFMQNPNRNDINSPHTRYKEDILNLWVTRKNGKYLKEPKLVWTKKKGQINQKQKPEPTLEETIIIQKPEPTLEETIKNYLKKQRI